jgi:hypothetical protein
MIELTESQRQAMNGESPPRIRDPQTNETFVLVRADVYERMRMIVDGYTKRAEWDDPTMTAYEKYRKQA